MIPGSHSRENNMTQSAHIASAPNGPAYVFTGAVDGEWTNLKNWEDANGNSPASSLPTSLTDVVIAGLVDTIPDDIEAGVGNLTILAGAEIRIRIKVGQDATVWGIIGNSNHTVFVGEKSCGSGELDMLLLGEKAKFYGVAENRGLVSGSAEFFDNSKQRGVVTGSVDLWHSSSMVETEEFDSPRCEGGMGLTMHNDSFAGGCIASDLYMRDSSHIDGDILVATTVLNINGDRIVDAGGDASLSDDSYLDGDGGLSAINIFMSERSHIEEGYTAVAVLCTINGPDAYNAGTIDGDATFRGTEVLNLNNVGTVTGTIEFIGDIPEAPVNFTMNGSNVWNYDTSAWIFTAPGPTWTFNESSSNTGTLAGNATFNSSSNNSGTVSGNATFNGSSNQLGTVTGIITCNTLGTCAAPV